MNLIRNKKGGEKLLSIWWFIVLTLVTAGLVLAVLIFYSAEYDVRLKEADSLHDKIYDCLVDKNDFLNQSFFE